MVIKKGGYDECGGECAVCAKFMCKPSGDAMILTKKKVSVKYVPPDTQAIKLLISSSEADKDVLEMSDEELLDLEERLFLKLGRGS